MQLVFHAEPVRLRRLPVDPPEKPVARDRRQRIGPQNAGGKIGEHRLALLLLLVIRIQKKPKFLPDNRAAQIRLVSFAGEWQFLVSERVTRIEQRVAGAQNETAVQLVVSAPRVDLDAVFPRLGEFRRISIIVDADLLNRGKRKVWIGSLRAVHDDGRRGSAGRVHERAERREDVAVFQRQIGEGLLVEREGVLMGVGSRVKPRGAALDGDRILHPCQAQRDPDKSVVVR